MKGLGLDPKSPIVWEILKFTRTNPIGSVFISLSMQPIVKQGFMMDALLLVTRPREVPSM